MTPPKLPTAENSGQEIGADYRRLTDAGHAMGSWTGLDPALGAPLSGALWGAGAGALYQGGQSLLDVIRGEKRPKRPWWRQPWAIGLGAGAATGLASGALQKFSSSPASVINLLLADKSLTPYERNRLIAAVRTANPSQSRQLFAAAASGALTAGIAYSILGVGAFGSAALGGITALMTRNLLPGPTRYV